MRHVSLAKNANIFEADEVKGFVHACATVDTEECMSVSAFLSSLDLDKDWVLKTALLSLLLIQLNSFVDIASIIHIIEFNTSWHSKFSLEILRQSGYELLHLLIEIKAVTDCEYVAYFIHHLYVMSSTERFQALLIGLESLLTLFIKIDVSCHFLNHQLHAILFSIRIKVVMQVHWNAFEMWSVNQHGMQDRLRVELSVQLVKEETKAYAVSMRELLSGIPHGQPFQARVTKNCHDLVEENDVEVRSVGGKDSRIFLALLIRHFQVIKPDGTHVSLLLLQDS